MNYRVLFFIIALTILLMGSILFFVVSAGANQVSSEVINAQSTNTLDSPTVKGAFFAVGTPTYMEDNPACATPHRRQAYVSGIFDYSLVPETCNVFINNRFYSTEGNLEPECSKQCPIGDFSRTFSLGFLDDREQQTIRVCCNDICLEKILPAQCVTA